MNKLLNHSSDWNLLEGLESFIRSHPKIVLVAAQVKHYRTECFLSHFLFNGLLEHCIPKANQWINSNYSKILPQNAIELIQSSSPFICCNTCSSMKNKFLSPLCDSPSKKCESNGNLQLRNWKMIPYHGLIKFADHCKLNIIERSL